MTLPPKLEPDKISAVFFFEVLKNVQHAVEKCRCTCFWGRVIRRFDLNYCCPRCLALLFINDARWAERNAIK
jgi:hypothetical protein